MFHGERQPDKEPRQQQGQIVIEEDEVPFPPSGHP
jgi:hypothetical protein